MSRIYPAFSKNPKIVDLLRLRRLVRRHETTMYDNLNILKLEMEVIRSITTDISVSMKRSTDLEEPLEGSPVVD